MISHAHCASTFRIVRGQTVIDPLQTDFDNACGQWRPTGTNSHREMAVVSRNPSIRRLARITYLLVLIFLPARLKTTPRPVANYLRQRFK